MPALTVTSKRSCNADMPIFTKVLKGLRDVALLSEKKGSCIESSLAKVMNKLSVADRERAHHDLHGVADVVEERPEFVEQCLADLESEICKLEDFKKNPYEMAKNINPDYICCRSFLLKLVS
jgi:hypothetical protein